MTRILDFDDGLTSPTAPTISDVISTSATVEAVGASDTITIDNSNRIFIITVTGDGGAQTASNTPFSTTPVDGAIIYLIGGDDTNTLSLTDNDSAGGARLNGNATLKKSYSLSLVYRSALDRFVEISRNF